MARAELVDGEPSVFAHEGSTIAGIRAGLLLGRLVARWSVADALSRQAVQCALDQLGAERPTWIQGQRGYVDTICDKCMRCRKPLRDDPDALNRRFCSRECALWAADENRRGHFAEHERWRGEAEAAILLLELG